jgi:DNA (cytosine-5)-methyltransferase 1
MNVVGLFAGIGGIEEGLHQAGHHTTLLCEIDHGAQAVLSERFPRIPCVPDIRDLRSLPAAEILAAGFPCQDLSQAGRTAGIDGLRSGLVGEVFRLYRMAPKKPRWLVLENVPFMLRLDHGKAMHFLTTQLEELNLTWAYRVVDTRAFGLPHRRLRVILVASASEDPREVLFADDAVESLPVVRIGNACGFYWTEGTRGLGWAVDAVPTLKGGSTIGIASPPAIWMPNGEIVTPDIADAERLQGFPSGWTETAQGRKARIGWRWKLVGNAVSVPVARWLGSRLASPGSHDSGPEIPLGALVSWPMAAWGRAGKTWKVPLSTWPVSETYQQLATFLQHPTVPLSKRAASGFYGRATRSSLRFPHGFLDAVAEHIRRFDTAAA